MFYFFPPVAVLIHDRPYLKMLWTFLLQLLGHVPGVIYGIYQVTRDWGALGPTAEVPSCLAGRARHPKRMLRPDKYSLAVRRVPCLFSVLFC